LAFENDAGNKFLTEDWIDRWQTGRIGWHEPQGNAGLRAHWPQLAAGATVLVPLCGKSPDLLWLAERGFVVTGVELSAVAAETFFSENNLAFSVDEGTALRRYVASDRTLEIFVGNYFEFFHASFDALYDRGALTALPPDVRNRYADHTNSLLRENATRLIVTLEFDQDIVAGPPFAVLPDEMAAYWGKLTRVFEKDDIATCPPKFIAAGLTEISEVIWLSSESE